MNKPCSVCKGEGHVTVKMKDLSGKSEHSCGLLGIVSCPTCLSKDYIDANDSKRQQSVEQYY